MNAPVFLDFLETYQDIALGVMISLAVTLACVIIVGAVIWLLKVIYEEIF